jgi:hypothetical protein
MNFNLIIIFLLSLTLGKLYGGNINVKNENSEMSSQCQIQNRQINQDQKEDELRSLARLFLLNTFQNNDISNSNLPPVFKTRSNDIHMRNYFLHFNTNQIEIRLARLNIHFLITRIVDNGYFSEYEISKVNKNDEPLIKSK